MFNFFDTRSKKEILQAKYDKLMEKAFYLEQTDLHAAELEKRKAHKVLLKIVELERAVA